MSNFQKLIDHQTGECGETFKCDEHHWDDGNDATVAHCALCLMGESPSLGRKHFCGLVAFLCL